MISKLVSIYTEGYLDPFFKPVLSTGKSEKRWLIKEHFKDPKKLDMLCILKITPHPLREQLWSHPRWGREQALLWPAELASSIAPRLHHSQAERSPVQKVYQVQGRCKNWKWAWHIPKIYLVSIWSILLDESRNSRQINNLMQFCNVGIWHEGWHICRMVDSNATNPRDTYMLSTYFMFLPWDFSEPLVSSLA